MRGNRKGCCLKKECYHRQGSRLVIRGNMKRTVPFAQEGSAGTPRSNSLVSSFGGCLAPRQDCFACKSVVHLSQMSHHRSEEHTSELQSPCNLVCRLLLETKKQ